jgi:sugar lactone lactonase YvrE
MGLMRVGPAGGVAEVVAVEAGGVPFNFTNGVDIDQATGDVYFTDSSTSYPCTRKDTSLPCVCPKMHDRGTLCRAFSQHTRQRLFS